MSNNKTKESKEVKQSKRSNKKDSQSSKQTNNGRSNKRNDSQSTDVRNTSVPTYGAVSYRACAHDNDIGWYSKDLQLLESSGRVSTAYPIGVDQNLVTPEFPEGVFLSNQAIPGIMTLDFIHGPGLARTNNDAVNRSINDIYVKIKTSTSANKPYSRQDLGLTLLAVDEVFILYYQMVRAYAIADTYVSLNRYYGRHIVTALGFDYDDLINNKALWFNYLRVVANTATSLILPADIPYFNRHALLSAYLYLDSDELGAKSHIYAFRSAGYRTFDETGITGGKLVWHAIDRTQPLTLSDVKVTIDSILNHLLGSQDVALMMSDIAAAYSNILSLPSVDFNLVSVPTYSDEIADQIMNARFVRYEYVDESSLNVTQDPTLNADTLIYWPKISNPAGVLAATTRPQINTMLNQPTPADVMLMTRLIFTLNEGGGEFAELGSEFLCGVRVWILTNNTLYQPEVTSLAFGDGDGADKALEIIQYLSYLEDFYHHPAVPVQINKNGAATAIIYARDTYNAVPLPESVLFQLNNTAILSLWNVPNNVQNAIFK